MKLYDALAAVNKANAEYAGEEHRQERTGEDDPDRLWDLHIAVLSAESAVDEAVRAIIRERIMP